MLNHVFHQNQMHLNFIDYLTICMMTTKMKNPLMRCTSTGFCTENEKVNPDKYTITFLDKN